MMCAIISLSNISKKFGRNEVLSNINLTIQKGQSIAFVGNNGSGKSTLLKIVCGLTNPTSGEVKCAKRLKFNYVPEHFPKMSITVKQYLTHMGLIEGMPENKVQEGIQELLKSFFMEQMTDSQMKHLSKGSLQKVAVIQALLSKPDVLLLDEPLSGQDVKSQRKFISMVKELNEQGVAILMSCHEMFLVNQLSSEAYEIKNMQLEPLDVTKYTDYDYDILSFEKPEMEANIPAVITEMIHKLDDNEGEIRMVVPREDSNQILMQMLQKGFKLRAMKGIDE
jgi:ABC-type multidrug transport system ATPase subunit